MLILSLCVSPMFCFSNEYWSHDYFHSYRPCDADVLDEQSMGEGPCYWSQWVYLEAGMSMHNCCINAQNWIDFFCRCIAKEQKDTDPAHSQPVVAPRLLPRTLGSCHYGLPMAHAHVLHQHGGGQTVDQEFAAYATAALSPHGIDILAFWNVSPLPLQVTPFSLTTSCWLGFAVHIPDYIFNCHGLRSSTSFLRCRASEYFHPAAKPIGRKGIASVLFWWKHCRWSSFFSRKNGLTLRKVGSLSTGHGTWGGYDMGS